MNTKLVLMLILWSSIQFSYAQKTYPDLLPKKLELELREAPKLKEGQELQYIQEWRKQEDGSLTAGTKFWFSANQRIGRLDYVDLNGDQSQYLLSTTTLDRPFIREWTSGQEASTTKFDYRDQVVIEEERFEDGKINKTFYYYDHWNQLFEKKKFKLDASTNFEYELEKRVIYSHNDHGQIFGEMHYSYSSERDVNGKQKFTREKVLHYYRPITGELRLTRHYDLEQAHAQTAEWTYKYNGAGQIIEKIHLEVSNQAEMVITEKWEFHYELGGIQKKVYRLFEKSNNRSEESLRWEVYYDENEIPTVSRVFKGKEVSFESSYEHKYFDF